MHASSVTAVATRRSGQRIPSQWQSGMRLPIDSCANSFENYMMTTGTIPTDVMDDAQAVADAVAAGKPVDPDVARRVQERSRLAQAELLKKFGMREIAVDLIREVRED